MTLILGRVGRLDRSDVLFVLRMGLIFVLGSLLFYYGGYVFGSNWQYAPYPEKKSVPFHVTSTASIMHGLDYHPGLPRMKVSLSEFIKESKDRPYIVSFEDGSKVYYTMLTKRAGIDIYLFAVQEAPGFDNDFGYDQITVVDYQKNEYSSRVTGTSYTAFIWSIVFGIIGLIAVSVAIGLSWSIWSDLSLRPYRKR